MPLAESSSFLMRFAASVHPTQLRELMAPLFQLLHKHMKRHTLISKRMLEPIVALQRLLRVPAIARCYVQQTNFIHCSFDGNKVRDFLLSSNLFLSVLFVCVDVAVRTCCVM